MGHPHVLLQKIPWQAPSRRPCVPSLSLYSKTVPYPKCLKGVLDLNDLLDIVGNGGNDLINEMYHAVGRMVVSLQQTGTVNSYNLPEEKQG